MTKYRLRLLGGRVIGPFEKNQLFELKQKGHIKGNEEFQIYPTGNWDSIRKIEFYDELMDENKTTVEVNNESMKEETFVIDLSKIRTQRQEKEIDSLVENDGPAIEQLTETIQIPSKEKKSPAQENSSAFSLESLPSLELEIEMEKAPLFPEKKIEDNSDKTIINPVAQQEIEKMRRLQKEADQKKIAEELEKQKEEERAKNLALEIAKEKEVIQKDESTQMIKINQLAILEEAQEEEQNIEKELKIIKAREIKEEEQLDNNETEPKNKKKKIILGIALALILFAIFFPEEKPKIATFKHVDPVISFPIPFDQSNNKKSELDFKKGLVEFNRGGYVNIIKAGISFKTSYENNMENLAALNFMVRAYSEQLQNSRQKLKDAQTIFNIIQSKKPFLMQDPNGVIGINLFYMTINKPGAAVDVIQKYLKLNPKNVTQDLFAVYLKSLIRTGKIDEAKQFLQALLKAKEKNRYTYSALFDYYMLNQEQDKAMDLARSALKENPNLPIFYLLNAELLIKEKKIDTAKKLLKKVEMMGLDSANINFAKFLELRGLIFVLENKSNQAAKTLLLSLKINDSDDLRIKLAELEGSQSDDKVAVKIINESKAVKFLIQAKEFYEKKNFDLAMSYSAKATEAYPGHIPSELFLAKVQLRLGLAKQAIQTLEDLVKKYPEDKKINFALIDAYIETYKFNDAKIRLQVISSTNLREAWEYTSLNAKLYLKMGDLLQAMSWLKNSINQNPLNDDDIFVLAQLLLRKANFDASRLLLNKCMELDPTNPEYRIAYARLIYETQDDLAAIGYLLSLKDDFGDHPKIMSEIAIFYYRSGKIKDFQDYKTKLEKDHSTDKALYEFLIKAALLDDRNKDIPPLVEKLVAIEPGDLESMMTAGRVLFEDGKLAEAAKWFKRVKDKLDSYPKVLYYMAKIDFLSGDLDGALKKIEENVKANGENDDDLVFMAQIYLAKDKFVDAENLYRRAQKINPRSYDAIVGLADLSTKRNNHDLALDLYKSAIKLRQDEPLVHKKLGDVYRQLGQGGLAIESYKLYLEMDPESPHKSNLEAYINLMK
jgi:tetratricopeptide (TPR) repeat protein